MIIKSELDDMQNARQPCMGLRSAPNSRLPAPAGFRPQWPKLKYTLALFPRFANEPWIRRRMFYVRNTKEGLGIQHVVVEASPSGLQRDGRCSGMPGAQTAPLRVPPLFCGIDSR